MKNKKTVAVLNRIFSIILIAALLFAGYVFITVMRTPKNEVPSVFGCSFLQVATGSMEPTIPIGSIIIVKNASATDVRVGDIITFYSPDPAIKEMPNTHRVTAIVEENGTPVFTTKGDAGVLEDPYPVPGNRLIGVYKFHFSIGKLSEIVHSKLFFFLVMLVPICAVISVEFLRIKKLAAEREAKKEEKNREAKAEKGESHEQEP